MPRIGVLTYATAQGLGHLSRDFYAHGIANDALIYEHPSGRETHREWYPAGTPVVRGRDFTSRNGPCRATVDEFLDRIDVLLCFETPFDWNILPLAKQHRVKTVLVPMYEWSLIRPPYDFDRVVCPSKLDQAYFPDAAYLPVPVTDRHWEPRERALRFLHNGGGIGHREHKGTRQLIEAIPYVKAKEFRITIRAQNVALRKILEKSPCLDSRVTVEVGEVPYDQLWKDHDVLIAPEKFNGLSLPLQEAFAAGMMVMTTNRFPMNDWLPRGPLIPVAGTQKVQVMSGHNWFEESIVDPVEIARTIDAWFGQEIGEYSQLGLRYAQRNHWSVLKEAWVQEIARVLEGK